MNNPLPGENKESPGRFNDGDSSEHEHDDDLDKYHKDLEQIDNNVVDYQMSVDQIIQQYD